VWTPRHCTWYTSCGIRHSLSIVSLRSNFNFYGGPHADLAVIERVAKAYDQGDAQHSYSS
jgi:hypothetical protein